jgi:opacity protein-like surface antigen
MFRHSGIIFVFSITLAIGAFAQAPSTTSLNAALMPKAATPQPAPSDSSFRSGRFELGVNFGGSVGYSFGNSSVHCAETVAGSCDPNGTFVDKSGTGLLSSAFTPGITQFFQHSGFNPGSGPSAGARLGFLLNPSWEIEFQFNHVNAPVSFQNLGLAQQAVSDFCDPSKFTNCFDEGPGGQRTANFRQDGGARGSQNQYFGNIIYNFNRDKRFVPYVGAGLGAVHYYNLPSLDISNAKDRGCEGDTVTCSVELTKSAGAETAFATDLLFGAKYHVTQHFGVRAEFQNVISFTGFRQTFRSIDNNDFCNPANGNGTVCAGLPATGVGGLLAPSGVTKQDQIWNHAQFTGGVFWKF